MKIVNMHTAKSTLSQLVAEVLNGEEIIIARSGKPIARLIPYEEEQEEDLRPMGLNLLPYIENAEFELLSATNPDVYEQSPTDPLYDL